MTAPRGVLDLLAVRLNATAAQVRFALLAGRFEDFRPVLGGAILITLREMERKQFATEGAAFGKVWPPLALRTLQDRMRKGFGAGPILVRTHRLEKSLAGHKSSADSVVKIQRFGMVFGTKVPWAVFHQQPEGPGKGIIPERKPIPDHGGVLPKVVLAEIRENTRDYLIEGRAARGRR